MSEEAAPTPPPDETGQTAPEPAAPPPPRRTHHHGRRHARGRRDVLRLVRDSGLPDRLEWIVWVVVQRTRLWRSEKADVAHELIDHFTQGLSAAETGESLEAAFGRPRRAARLIRRAKRRQRSILWKTWLRTVQVVGILLAVAVGVYVAATIRLISGRPKITHDYLADLTATARAVPEAERAWPLYRRALDGLGELPSSVTAGNGDPRPGDPDWARIETFLVEHAEQLRLAREAAARPGLGYVVDTQKAAEDVSLWPHLASGAGGEGAASGTLWSALLPQILDLGRLAHLLALDAYRDASVGDGDGAEANIEAILGIAGQTRETALISGDQASLRQVAMAVFATGEILTDYPDVLTDDQLRRLAHRFVALRGDALDVRLEAELLAFDDLMQRLYTDNGEGDGRLTAQGMAALGGVGGYAGPLAPVVGLVVAGRQEMTNEFGRWYAKVEAEEAKPLWRQDVAALDRELERLRASWFYRNRYPPVVWLMPALTHAGRLPELARQECDAVTVAIALELYHRRTGEWPAELAELVPDLLPAVPLDRFDGRPLRYRVVDGTPLIYSIGSDGNDDGGRAPRDAAGHAQPQLAKFVDMQGRPMADGDWVLWPSAPPAPPDDSGAEYRAGQPAPLAGS